jgi:hypothetical protein
MTTTTLIFKAPKSIHLILPQSFVCVPIEFPKKRGPKHMMQVGNIIFTNKHIINLLTRHHVVDYLRDF